MLTPMGQLSSDTAPDTQGLPRESRWEVELLLCAVAPVAGRMTATADWQYHVLGFTFSP